MDVPISLGVILVTGLSLAQTMQGGAHTYFDSAITLLFFLLIGRVLDHRARGQARATAESLLMLRATDVAVLQSDGTIQRRAQHAVAPGDRVLVGLGERIGVDGVVERGSSMLDSSLVTGESLPAAAAPGTLVFAGTLNLGETLIVRATATGNGTLLAECARLIEAADARRSRFVVLADRVARRYAPAVHVTALATFLWWYFAAGAPIGEALLIASAVLIITCPCALALAVPVVQVIATGRLFRAGVLLKSPTALERLADVDTVPTAGGISSLADTSRFAGLIDVYTTLATSDPVIRKLQRRGLIDEAEMANGTSPITAVPVVSTVGGGTTPMMMISATAPTSAQATALTRAATTAFLAEVTSRQAAAKIPVKDRIQLRVVKAADEPNLIEPRSKAIPMLVLLAGLIATAAVAFTRDNVTRNASAPTLAAASPAEATDADRSAGVAHAGTALGRVPRPDAATTREETGSSIAAAGGRSTLGSIVRPEPEAERERDLHQPASPLRKASGRPQG